MKLCPEGFTDFLSYVIMGADFRADKQEDANYADIIQEYQRR